MQSACAILSSLASPILQYFFALSHKRQNSRENEKENGTEILHLNSSIILARTFLNLPRIQRDVFINVYESSFKPLNPELNPICYLLALLGAHHFLRVSRIRVKLLTFRRLLSYIYGAPILDVSRSHTMTQQSRQDSSGRVISSSQRPLPDSTRHSQQTNIHAPDGIRTHDLSR